MQKAPVYALGQKALNYLFALIIGEKVVVQYNYVFILRNFDDSTLAVPLQDFDTLGEHLLLQQQQHNAGVSYFNDLWHVEQGITKAAAETLSKAWLRFLVIKNFGHNPEVPKHLLE